MTKEAQRSIAAALASNPRYEPHGYTGCYHHGDDDQIVPIADSALLSVKLLKRGILKVCKGLGHGLCTINHDVVNADLLAFV